MKPTTIEIVDDDARQGETQYYSRESSTSIHPTMSTAIVNVTQRPGSAMTGPSSDRIGNLVHLVEELQIKNALLEQRKIPWYSEKFNSIPRFEPGISNLTTVQWIYKIEQMAATNRWNQNTMIAFMQSRLTGLVKKYHHDFAAALKVMLARKKGERESWGQYYFDKIELIRARELHEKHANKINYKDTRRKKDKRVYQYQRHKPKCYNCYKVGHLANTCPNQRMSIQNIKDLDIQVQIVQKTHEMCRVKSSINKCYYTTCEINEQKFLEYVDTGCGVLQGYNNSVTKILGIVIIHLRVDLAVANVKALVVENLVQAIPILIGQECINKNKILMVRKNDVRILEDDNDVLLGIDHSDTTNYYNGCQ
ncbi:hypothetical protein NQ314_011301 [Rhamnusium bicolor]|uniref:CCHC-type domain-containing protein n=1 Tax=Rhamnusium bicolor TaxID=1586634 RepID=A0AAV8XJ79_9CUCU|nr:hypothetical protein NQ314_011301 [Rhamnusium bicolor]